MFSRRVFELLVCGTNVVSGHSLGIKKMLGDVVLISHSSEETKRHIKNLIEDRIFSEKLSLLGIRKVVNEHTYTHRFNTIVGKLKINNCQVYNAGISILSILTDSSCIENIVKNYNQQKYDKKELIIIVKSDDIDTLFVRNYIENIENVYLYQINENCSLGECLNYGVSKSNKEYISIFSEADYYGSNYLTDLMNAFKYPNANIVGKATIFKYQEDESQLIIYKC